jgi:undecaprenyl pyrophosphate phosphatase UppP
MKDKIGIVLGIGIAFAVLATLYFYLRSAENIDLSEIISIGIVLILVASAFYILWDRIKNIKKGLPAQDERSKLTAYRAGNYGFIATIWSAVGGPLLSDILLNHELQGSHVTAVVVLCGGMTFIISYIYLYWKGN